MRLGLFGGAFNPIHLCHLATARHIRDRLKLDRVLFIPTGDPPHKPADSLAPASHRCAMIKLAIAPEPTFALSEIELTRTAKSYSIDTVRQLKAELGQAADLFFLVGLDAFLELPTWKDANTLLALCHFVVVSRPPSHFAQVGAMSLLPPLPETALREIDKGERPLLEIALKGATRLMLLALPPCPISASDVRERLRRRLPTANLLPTPVESYILQHHLYQEGSDRTDVEGESPGHRTSGA